MDTTGSLAMLASGTVDIALTYNPAAEKQMMNCGAAIERIYAFRVCSTVFRSFDSFLMVRILGPLHACWAKI